jgi:hypothetical protein
MTDIVSTDMIAERDARITQLETDLGALHNTLVIRAASPRIMGTYEEAILEYIATQIDRALHPDDYQEDHGIHD